MAAAAHILIVDDDASVSAVLSEGLRVQGYTIEIASSAAAARRAVNAATAIDLITLDLNLAEADGLELALEIRAKRNVPIIMISGRTAPEDRVSGFEHGADDYVVKPFHIKEVAHRIRALLARYAPQTVPPSQPQEIYTFELGTLDAGSRSLLRQDGNAVDLTDAEFDLLLTLMRHAKRVLSREQLMQILHQRSWEPLDRTLDVHVARLRRKIEPAGDAPRYIKSVRNVGYVFAQEVVRG